MLQGEHSAILSTSIKLPFSIKILVLSIFKWPLKTCFTVHYFDKLFDAFVVVSQSPNPTNNTVSDCQYFSDICMKAFVSVLLGNFSSGCTCMWSSVAQFVKC